MAGSVRWTAGRALAMTLLALALVLATPVVAGAKPVVGGTKVIRLATPQRGGGAHPILRWKALPSAADYLVVVQTPGGDPFWMSRTSDTRLRLGGGPLDAPKQTEGAALVTRKVWFVLAFDGDGDVIGSSAKRTIAP